MPASCVNIAVAHLRSFAILRSGLTLLPVSILALWLIDCGNQTYSADVPQAPNIVVILSDDKNEHFQPNDRKQHEVLEFRWNAWRFESRRSGSNSVDSRSIYYTLLHLLSCWPNLAGALPD